jgi:hypothetical protein
MRKKKCSVTNSFFDENNIENPARWRHMLIPVQFYGSSIEQEPLALEVLV